MANEEEKISKKSILERNKLFNDKKEENITFNINLAFKKKDQKFQVDSLKNKHNNTISYSISKFFNLFSSVLLKNTNKLLVLKKSKNIKKKKNRAEVFSDKIIQTPAFLFNINNIIINNSHFASKINKQLNIKKTIINSYIPLQNNKKRYTSTILKSKYSAKSFLNNPFTVEKPHLSRNKLNPIKFFDKGKETKIKNLKGYLSNGYSINPISEKRKHNNLLDIENIYIQGKKHLNNFISNKSMQNDKIVKKFELFPLNRKVTIKKIKYPLGNGKNKTIKIINENNEHLIEKIYKNQTISNFNNKYKLKYKSKDVCKKENIKFLFSLLKRHKNSEKDKNDIFYYYSMIKKKKKEKYNI